jgi:hypothetical protein
LEYLCEEIKTIKDSQCETLSLISEINTANQSIKLDQKTLIEHAKFYSKYVFSNNFILGRLFRFMTEKMEKETEGVRKYIPANEHKEFVNSLSEEMLKETKGVQQ